ncbi:MAG: transketolase [Proteocatella sp.]
MKNNSIDILTINTIRTLSADAVQKANSGHPGLPLGAAPAAYALWKKMNHNPRNPKWLNRDRFVLSAGHGSMLMYSLLHVFGYDLNLEDIKNFRQLNSKTPGHPEYNHTPGIETTTGPLGQGIANAVGMAISESFLAKTFNRDGFDIINHFTYVLAGDGCLMEGISSEACSLAGTLELGKLILIYDSNNISIEGSTDLAFKENVALRYRAYGWQVIEVPDGNDIEDISKAIDSAKAEMTKPSLIIVKTQIGYGCPAKQGTASAHGEALGKDNVAELKNVLEFPSDKDFFVPKTVHENRQKYINDGIQMENDWNKLLEKYKYIHPELYKNFSKTLDTDIQNILLKGNFWQNFEKALSTREASGILINKISEMFPNFIGGSADLAPSNKTHMSGKNDYSALDRTGRNIHFGVREHAMAAITNGMYLHGGTIPYCATFLVFSDYMKAAMRLSAIMKLPITYVLTHDSIGVGEDGPTHQPIEQLTSLRSIPNMTVFRPADAKETACGWYHALSNKIGPTSLILSRQTLPLYEETGSEALKGAYILKEGRKNTPDIILMASGSEVELIYKAYFELENKGLSARVVSVPSIEIFEMQSEEYKKKILPPEIKARVAVEASSGEHWYKYLGLDGKLICMETFGASGKASELFEYYNFTLDNIVKVSENVIYNTLLSGTK